MAFPDFFPDDVLQKMRSAAQGAQGGEEAPSPGELRQSARDLEMQRCVMA